MASITHIDHIAIAVNSIDEVRSFYEQALGLSISAIEIMPDRGLKAAFITIGQSRIELLEPLHDRSEVAPFLAKKGPGIHHIAFATKNIDQAEAHLKATGARLTYEQARPGAHQTRVNFIHPKTSGGVLMELVQDVAPSPQPSPTRGEGEGT